MKTSDAIAVVGMAGRFPGAATLADFWQNLRLGVDGRVSFSDDELRAAGVSAELLADPRYVKAGPVLENIDLFDAAFFGFSAREAELLDPQHRILMECAWEALEDAGCDPRRWPGSIGIYAGSAISGYLLWNLHSMLDTSGAAGNLLAMMGNDKDYLASHIAYKLGLTGPAVSVQTACSTSLVAVHMACQSLLSRECDMALAGGVTVRVPQKTGYLREEGSILSGDGRCRSFDAAASGTVFASGAGLVVLRRLDDALAAGDRIRAVILGSAVNNDGGLKAGFTAPSPDGEAAVIAEAMAVAGVDADSVSYVEAHGTGTEIGDPIEIAALTEAFGAASRTGSCAIGTVKQNVGHLEAAAGIAGLIKVVLQIEHGLLPPSPLFRTPNPRIDFGRGPFYVNTELAPWAGHRRAGVSSFGIGGTNAHVIVEQAPDVEGAPLPVTSGPELLCLSARSEAALVELCRRHAALVADPLADWAYSAGAGRAHHSHRLALVAGTAAAARQALMAHAAGETGAITGRSDGHPPRIGFLFTGQGAQYVGMGRALYDRNAAFRAVLDRCDGLLRRELDLPLLDVMFDPRHGESRIHETRYAQPALFALAMALHEVWRSAGIKPAAVLGHSIGEYAAACAAGVFDLPEGLRLVARRGRLMQALPAGGIMAAVAADEARVLRALDGFADVAVAACNGPRNTVISGGDASVSRVIADLAAHGIPAQRLTVSHAFHSPLVDGMLDDLERAAREVRYQTPRIPVVGNLTGTPQPSFDAGYFREHARQPVRFADGLAAMAQLGCDTFIEIGPHSVLSDLGPQNLEGTATEAWLPTLRRGDDGISTLLGSLGRLYVRGVDVDFAGFAGPGRRRKVTLPTYPWQRKRYFIDAPRTRRVPVAAAAAHPLLGRAFATALGDTIHESSVGIGSPGLLAEHRVHGRAVFPAAGYIEMALQAGFDTIEDLAIDSALLLREEGDTLHTLQCIVGSDGKLRIFCAEGDGFRRLVSAQVSRRDHSAAEVASDDAVPGDRQPVDVDAIYAAMAEAGLAYGPRFRVIANAERREGEASVEISLPQATANEQGSYCVHPAVLDAAFQALAIAVGHGTETFMPIGIERIAWSRTRRPCRFAHAVVRGGRVGEAESMTGDVQLLDDERRPVLTLTAIHCRRASRDALHGAPGASAIERHLYEVVWPATKVDPPPATLALSLQPVLDDLDRDARLLAHAAASDALERIAIDYVVAALRRLDCRLQAGAAFAPPEVAPRHARLMARLVEMLQEDGVLAGAADSATPGERTVLRVPPTTYAEERRAALHAALPDRDAEAVLLARCGEALADVLRDRIEPLSLLFPADGAGAESAYRDAPLARIMNELTAQVVAAASPRGCRILEVGAGTGATTRALLPLLDEPGDYLFTDLSPAFLASAERHFETHGFLRTARLDIENAPEAQGFEAGGFDVVLAANVLHATADLRASLDHITRLLRPGGLVVVVEGTTAVRWLDLTFGLTEGWWRFRDADLRPAHPLLAADRWKDLLAEQGFVGATAIIPGNGAAASQVLLLARKPMAPAGTWIVSGADDDLGRAIESGLAAAGGRGVLAAPDTALSPDDTCVGMMHVTDGSRSREHDIERALSVVRSLPNRAGLKLILATIGAQRVHGFDTPDPGQAPLLGIARTIVHERPDLRCTAVDLDPRADAAARAAALTAEAIAGDGETETAWREGVRRGARLSRLLERESPLSVPDGPFRLHQTTPGIVDGLRLLPSTRIPPKDDEVEVRVLASGLNFKDVLSALDVERGAPALGGECAGRVAAVGRGVTAFAVGDPVVAVGAGTFASHVTLPVAQVFPIPPGLTYEQAAALPIASVTAWYALDHVARLAPGERVLIHSAAGGVGQAAVHIARRAGAEIFATAGSPERRALLRAMGIVHVMDSRTADFATEVLAATAGQGVDVVLSALAGDLIGPSLAVLKERGCFIEIGRGSDRMRQEAAAVRPHARYECIALDAVTTDVFGPPLQEVLALYAGGTLPLPPLTVVPIERARDGFRRLQSAGHAGKVVLGQRHHEPIARPNASYLITGGIGGLGLETAAWLVRHGARHLALVSRRAPDDRASAIIARLTSEGARILVLQADVARATDVERVLARIGAELPPLAGIIHAAGVLQDGLLDEQNAGTFTAVMEPKVDGAAHLLHLAPLLDFFVMFSSAAGLLGSPGQANHAAASASLDAVAHVSRARGLPVTSIDWGAWSEVGAAAQRSVPEALRSSGMGTIAPAQGLFALEQIFRADRAQVAVLPIDWPILLGRYQDATLPSLLRMEGAGTSDVVPLITTATAPSHAATASELLASIESVAPELRHETLLRCVWEEASRMLGLDRVESLHPRRPLNELGLDSLMAVELRNRLSVLLDRTLPATLLFNYPTVTALTDYLGTEILGLPQAPPQADDRLADEVRQLSEDELDSVLEDLARRHL